MHAIVLREEVYEKFPWVAQSLCKAFAESKRICEESLYKYSALKYMLAWSFADIEEEKELFGDQFWPYGLEANRHVLETLIQYSSEQGLIKKLPELKSLFAPTLWKILRFEREEAGFRLYGRRKNSAFEKPNGGSTAVRLKNARSRLRRPRASLNNGPTSCSRDTTKTRRPKTSSISIREFLKNSRLLQGNGDTFLSKWAPIPLKGSPKSRTVFRCRPAPAA
jgi:hypothetical protein